MTDAAVAAVAAPKRARAFALNEGRINSFMRSHTNLKRKGKVAGRYLAGVIEEITAEILAQAAVSAPVSKKTGVASISARNIRGALSTRRHLRGLFHGAVIVGGGVDHTFKRRRSVKSKSKKPQ